jgi:hypothetical protein
MGKKIRERRKGVRSMFKFSFPTTDESNGWIRDGSIGQKMESILGETQPEAAYFGSVDGNRGGYFVINIDEASEIPAKLEPPFQGLGAAVECSPVMTSEDLRTAIQSLR